MALPKINSSPQYEVTVPSTGEKIQFRPYLVKEEKVLMVAFESGDEKQATRAIGNTLNACISTEGIDAFELTTYDVEYLFTQVRTRSVGETSNVIIPCQSCEHKNEQSIPLDSVVIENAENVKEVHNITDDIQVELCYPSYQTVLNQEVQEGDTASTAGLQLVEACVSAILTEDERYDTRDLKKGELREFLENLTTDQFRGLTAFLAAIPRLTHDVHFTCVNCGHENTVTLNGMRDFLS